MKNNHLSEIEILAYLDDKSNIGDEGKFIKHLDECQKCFNMYARLAAPASGIDFLDIDSIPDEIRIGFIKKLKIWEDFDGLTGKGKNISSFIRRKLDIIKGKVVTPPPTEYGSPEEGPHPSFTFEQPAYYAADDITADSPPVFNKSDD